MLVMLGFAGLVIDVGHQMTEYRQARNAADAAALSAAYNLYSDSNNTEFTATQLAQRLVEQNGFQDSNLTLTFLHYSYVVTLAGGSGGTFTLPTAGLQGSGTPTPIPY